MTIARGTKNMTLYMTTDGYGLTKMAEGREDPNLWHQRFGHISSQRLKCLHSRGKLPGLKSVEVDFYKSCILGKQKRVSFKKTRRASVKEKLELVHTDVCGPASVSSIGDKQYFVTFIDNHSRKVWGYFLRHRSNVFEAFKKWKAMVENKTGLKIKKLHSDNGGEYKYNEFKKFCYKSGIKLIRIVPGTPQQNGIAECMNRTLTERARSIRLQSGLLKQFWAEAVNTAAYLINRGPSKPLDLAIPEEIWTGKEVKLSHVKVFGCVSYVHVSDHARSKLDAKSLKCTLVGYGEDEFGYKLWDDQNRKMIRSRDVVFNEKVMYNDRNAEPSEQREPDYFGPEDVSGGKAVEHGSNHGVEKQSVQPQVEKPIPQNEILSPQSPIGQRVLNP
ncbi:hypothetical protein LWI28_006810 [Acer negundo]|uniref:Integrase catalytic domain-containing protein n=1 Tax=Acer negundo TaxID=4023 RepID=A0AAD5I812_ACENE|nr:hypothetical protein LWI28_006810 [Acer negundo]